MSSEAAKPKDVWALPLFGVFGLFILAALLWLDFVPDLWANAFYIEGRCVLLDKRITEHHSRKASNLTYRPEFLIRYTVDGQEYRTWAYRAVKSSSALRWPKERLLESYTVGQEYPCWYDAADPSKVIFVRGYSWFSYALWLAFAVLAGFTAWGIVGRVRSIPKAA